MWALTLWEHAYWPLQWGVVIGASLLAAVCDLGTRRIPNALTGPLLLAGLVWAAWTGGAADVGGAFSARGALSGLADAGSACLLLALPYSLLFAFAGGGAGDAKLMGAIGAWLGLVNGAMALAAVALAGGVIAIGFAVAKRRLGPVLSNLAAMASGLMYLAYGRGTIRQKIEFLPKVEGMQAIPYGVAILTGISIAAGGVFAWRTH